MDMWITFLQTETSKDKAALALSASASAPVSASASASVSVLEEPIVQAPSPPRAKKAFSFF